MTTTERSAPLPNAGEMVAAWSNAPEAERGCARADRPPPSGFTLLEVLFVIMIGGVLLAIALPAFGQYRARQRLENTRDAFMLLAATARAEAIQRGGIATLKVQVAEQRVVLYHGGDVLKVLDYADRPVRLDTQGGSFKVCYSARGFALQSCNAEKREVHFIMGGDTARAIVGPLGDVERP